MYHVVPSWHLWMPETEIANNWKRTKQKCLKFSDCFLLWTVAHNLVLRLKPTSSSTQLPWSLFSYIYRVSHELRSLLRESVPYVKIYRYNRKHLCPKLNGYGDNGKRKVWTSWGCTHYTCQLAVIYVHPCVGCHVTEFLLTVARSQELFHQRSAFQCHV